MKGDVKAIVGTVSTGVSLVTEVLKDEKFKKFAKLAKGLTALSFALPIASIALDLVLGSDQEPDPMLAEISGKIDALSTKVD